VLLAVQVTGLLVVKVWGWMGHRWREVGWVRGWRLVPVAVAALAAAMAATVTAVAVNAATSRTVG
jgi:hypothetical protein